MTRLEVQIKIKSIREELEARHKTGVVKSGSEGGIPVPTRELQSQLFSLIYKLSKME
jgi:hypothetical protein